MTQPETTSPGVSGPWPVLDPKERRALGVLVEKQKTTPDAYPMSLNALVTGCNQKSNRDPVMFLSEDDVEYTLSRLQKGGLVIKITGGRVERWRHTLYDTWHVDKVEMAVLGELLLRGPQTEGELRTRARSLAIVGANGEERSTRGERRDNLIRKQRGRNRQAALVGAYIVRAHCIGWLPGCGRGDDEVVLAAGRER